MAIIYCIFCPFSNNTVKCVNFYQRLTAKQCTDELGLILNFEALCSTNARTLALERPYTFQLDMLHKIFTCHYSHIPEFILMLCVFSGSVFFSFLHKHTHTHTHQRTLAHLRWKNTSQPSNICCCSLFPHIWKLFFSRGINREMFGHEKKINATSEKLFANLMHARTLK